MNSQQRERMILKELIENSDGIVLLELAERAKVSKRTIYNDLKNVKEYLFDTYKIQTLKGQDGIFLSDEDRRYLSGFEINLMEEESFAVISRTYQITRFLLRNKTTTLQEIANHLYYSKSTITQEMPHVESLLSKFSLYIEKKPYFGIMLQGNEVNRRFLIHYMISDQLEDVDLSIENMLSSSHIIPKNISDAISMLKNEYVELFNLDVLICIYTMYIRTKSNNTYHVSEMIESMYENSDYFERAQELLDAFEQQLDITFAKDEVYYLLMHMDLIVQNSKDNKQVGEVVEEIMNLLYEKYSNLDLHESMFYTGLFVHVTTMINRIKIGKVLRNPILHEIKETIPYAFNIAADIGIMLKSRFEINMNEEEIGLLSMHIQAILEEVKQDSNNSVDAIVVSHLGYGNTLLLASSITSNFPNIKVNQRITLHQAELLIWEGQIGEDTLIISTTHLNLEPQRYVVIQPILEASDLDKISDYISYRNEQSSEVKNRSLLTYLNEQYIFTNQSFTSKQELLRFVCDKLENENYVTDGFYESVLSRENISSTYSINGVALPHGYSKYVNNPIVAVVVLNKPLNWDGYYADVIMVCALPLHIGTAERGVVEDIYDVINNRELLSALKISKNGSAFIDNVCKGLQGEINESK